MAWEVEYTDEFGTWYAQLETDAQYAIVAAVELLEVSGPGLGRPMVDGIKRSRHANMKELRPAGGVRILFAFDPRRMAILLLGGDKTNRWRTWYDETIPVADRLYDDHIRLLREEGLL